MERSYLFRVGPNIYILNIQYSTCGGCYPRLLIHFPDLSYLNYDITLGKFFDLTEEEWNIKFDKAAFSSLFEIEEVEQVCVDYGLDFSALTDIFTCLTQIAMEARDTWM